jgi:hypothetical protein
MKKEQQVCSRELAIRLKELGVSQESLYYWCEVIVIGSLDGNPDGVRYELLTIGTPKQNPASAFTVSELGKMLPREIDFGGKSVPLELRGMNAYGEHLVAYHIEFEPPIGLQCEKTEADARAKCLTYLLEKNIIKVENL